MADGINGSRRVSYLSLHGMRCEMMDRQAGYSLPANEVRSLGRRGGRDPPCVHARPRRVHRGARACSPTREFHQPQFRALWLPRCVAAGAAGHRSTWAPIQAHFARRLGVWTVALRGFEEGDGRGVHFGYVFDVTGRAGGSARSPTRGASVCSGSLSEALARLVRAHRGSAGVQRASSPRRASTATTRRLRSRGDDGVRRIG